MSLFLFVTTLMLLGLGSSIFEIIVSCFKDSKKRSDEANNRKIKERKSWREGSKRFSGRMFYRLFRMHRPCFNRLCARIEKAVGQKEFKSENYIDRLRSEKNTTILPLVLQ